MSVRRGGPGSGGAVNWNPLMAMQIFGSNGLKRDFFAAIAACSEAEPCGVWTESFALTAR